MKWDGMWFVGKIILVYWIVIVFVWVLFLRNESYKNICILLFLLYFINIFSELDL